MFTGLISDIGDILAVAGDGEKRRLRIACGYDADTIALGASIACSGPCLTVVCVGRLDGREDGRTFFEVDAAAETLKRTTVGAWAPGRRVNLERALTLRDELGGHVVTGHIDGVAHIVARRDFEGMAEFTIAAPDDLARFIAPKGSVALDGASLTVNDVAGARFTILLIPHTLAVTTWGERAPGDPVNLEVDLMARYAARLMERA